MLKAGILRMEELCMERVLLVGTNLNDGEDYRKALPHL